MKSYIVQVITTVDGKVNTAKYYFPFSLEPNSYTGDCDHDPEEVARFKAYECYERNGQFADVTGRKIIAREDKTIQEPGQ